MDFGKTFDVDIDLAENGVWFGLGDDGEILIGRHGNRRYREALKKHTQGHEMALQLGSMKEEEAQEIYDWATAEGLIYDWRKMTDEGKPIKFSPSNAYKMVRKYPEFRTFVESLAGNVENYKRKQVEEMAGNLPDSSGSESK